MWCKAVPTPVASSPAVLKGLPNPRQRGDALSRLLLGIHSLDQYDAVDCGPRLGKAKAGSSDLGGCHPCHERVVCRSCRVKPLGARVRFPNWLHSCLQSGEPDRRTTVIATAEWERARELGTTAFVESMIEGEPPVAMPWVPEAYGLESGSSGSGASAAAEPEEGAAAAAAAAAVAEGSEVGDVSLDQIAAYALGDGGAD